MLLPIYLKRRISAGASKPGCTPILSTRQVIGTSEIGRGLEPHTEVLYYDYEAVRRADYGYYGVES